MRFLLVILTFAAVILPGLAHGVWSCRWAWSNEPFASAEKLKHVPLFFADWDAKEIKIPTAQIKQSEVAGFLARRYTHRFTRNQIQVFLACGRPGPVSLHTPDICYAGAGYRMEGTQSKTTVKGNGSSPPAEFFTATFQKPNPTNPVKIKIYWSWSTNGAWQAPAYPRLTFARHPALYKLYVISPRTTSEEASEEEETSKIFIKKLLLHLQKSLFSAP